MSPDKEAVLKEAYRVLKIGGELYFSDVYSDRRVPRSLVEDPVLYGECLSGALYWNDFINLAKQTGFKDPRLVEDAPITISNKKIEDLIGHIKFFSATYRLFKIAELEPACEDYGQAVIYRGGIYTCPNTFVLDAHHTIETGKVWACCDLHINYQKKKVFPVCSNTYRMLKQSRFAPFFEFIGNEAIHYGIFQGCGIGLPFQNTRTQVSDRSSCCS